VKRVKAKLVAVAVALGTEMSAMFRLGTRDPHLDFMNGKAIPAVYLIHIL
jgi:hypothetical protein